MSRAHLELMSKPRLIGLIHTANQRAETHARTAEHWRSVVADLLGTAPPKRRKLTPEQTREDAEDILARLPRDPNAEDHRLTLWRETAPPRPAPRPIRHGTRTGYRQHRRRQEAACDACKAAAAEAQRRIEAARKDAA